MQPGRRGTLTRMTLVTPVIACLASLLASFATAAAAIDIATLPAATERKIDFAADIRPIFQTHCVSCHGAEKQKSDYRLDDRESALKGGSIGGAVAPGDSAKSKLIHYVAALDEDMVMPPKGKRLSAEQIGLLRAWIDQGATWAEAAPKGTTPPLWSLAPLKKPAVPAVKNSAWVRSPVDAFILAKLEAAKMSPAPPSDPRTLIRRVTFDLTGLPPTPAEVHAFVKEWAAERSEFGVRSSELKDNGLKQNTAAAATPTSELRTRNYSAYDRLVDRLLASPRYGERWARHWMDAVHFAETHGHDEDKPRPNAWPYRDYLIQAFNDDRPYSRFIEEQVAGDALYPDDPQALVGTAMLAAGPWDQSSQMGIQDGTTDKKAAQYLDRDDMLTTAIGTFNSVTVHCARCHNHKFDPISQADYYALQAVFAGVDRTERSYDADPAVSAKRRALLKEKSAIESAALPRETLLSAAMQHDAGAWEKSLGDKGPTWRVLDPSSFTSSGGATLTKLPDGSILSGGTRPEKDTTTFIAQTDTTNITAVMLEVLTDDSLSHKGPGRQDNGNLHLSEVKILYGEGPKPQSAVMKIKRATADFDQQGWTIAHAIDGQPQTAWGIFPNVGKPHSAVFELEHPIANATGGTITIVLEQLHGGGHLIGRARLSVTNAPAPFKVNQIPDAIAAILAVAADKRSDDQRAALALHAAKLRTDRELAALPPQSRVYTVASEFTAAGNFKPAVTPRPIHMLRRGDVLQPIEAAVPGAITAVAGLEPRFKLSESDGESARRAALARWISAKDNVLTWRSIVNRVWHHHFGRGIVDTPSDLGRMGGEPSHPELLDYLAVTFRDDYRGSLKKLHKLIVTSSAYMQSSKHSDAFAAIDADNRLLWRMNRSRLDAEQLRDAVVAISGKLDFTMGGPSARQFLESKGIHETPTVDYIGFDPDHPANFRRSIYRFIFRTVPDPLMDTLDCPDASLLTAKRTSSVTALQALSMLNNRFLVRQYEHIAARLQREAPADAAAQVRLLHDLALSRPATANELKVVVTYADKHGLANAVRVILNSNEFMFIN